MRKLISKLIKLYQFNPIQLTDLYDKIDELEKRIVILEEENIETTNVLYQTMNSIDAVDARIDIITLQQFLEKHEEGDQSNRK